MILYKASLPKDIYTYIKNVCATEESVRAFIYSGDIYDPIIYKSILLHCIRSRQWSQFMLCIGTAWFIKEYDAMVEDYVDMPVNIIRVILQKSQNIAAFLLYCRIYKRRENYPILRMLYNDGLIPLHYELYGAIRKYCSERLWGHLFWSIIMRLRIREFRERYYALHAPGYLLAKQKFEKKIHAMNLLKND